MNARFPELDVVRLSLSEDTRSRHLAVIADEIRTSRPRRRYRLLAVAIATVLLLPVIALAAERSGPGDLLYPIRQVLDSWAGGDSAPSPDRGDVRPGDEEAGDLTKPIVDQPGEERVVDEAPAIERQHEPTPDVRTREQDGHRDNPSRERESEHRDVGAVPPDDGDASSPTSAPPADDRRRP